MIAHQKKKCIHASYHIGAWVTSTLNSATHCNTLEYTATQCTALQRTDFLVLYMCMSQLESLIQIQGLSHSNTWVYLTLHVIFIRIHIHKHDRKVKHVVSYMCMNHFDPLIQCVAVCCSVLQCVAVWHVHESVRLSHPNAWVYLTLRFICIRIHIYKYEMGRKYLCITKKYAWLKKKIDISLIPG